MSIIAKLQNSSFGKFSQAIKVIEEGVPPGTFTLPRVVIVGSESAGKSSILEAITKCPIFPRATNVITKCPVVFELIGLPEGSPTTTEVIWQGTATSRQVHQKLENADDILSTVRSIFDGIGDTIVKDEIVIVRSGPGLPTLTFVDLPGIRAMPLEMKESSQRIVDYYMSLPDTIIICVMEAGKVITTDQAVGSVLDANKQAYTILALSKCDLLADTKVDTSITRRVLGEDDSFKGYGFRGCVATRCRDQVIAPASGAGPSKPQEDEFALHLLEAKEDAWATEFVKKSAAQNPRTPKDLEDLRKNLTVANLLVRLNEFYHSYICEKWKPRAIAKLTPLFPPAEKVIADLGTNPTELKASGVLLDIENKLKRQQLIAPKIPEFSSVTKPRNTREAGIEAQGIEARFNSWLDASLKTESPSQLLCMAQLETTIAAVFNEDLPMKTARFGEARRLITDAIMAAFIAQVNAEREGIVRRARDQLRVALTGGCAVADVAQRVVSELLYFCVTPALSAVGHLANTCTWVSSNSAALLTESPDRAAARVSANAKLASLRKSLHDIETIEELMESDMPAPVWQSTSTAPATQPAPAIVAPQVPAPVWQSTSTAPATQPAPAIVAPQVPAPVWQSTYTAPATRPVPAVVVPRDPDCIVCLERCNAVTFGCGHQTCAECGNDLTECPLCRAPITTRRRTAQ